MVFKSTVIYITLHDSASTHTQNLQSHYKTTCGVVLHYAESILATFLTIVVEFLTKGLSKPVECIRRTGHGFKSLCILPVPHLVYQYQSLCAIKVILMPNGLTISSKFILIECTSKYLNDSRLFPLLLCASFN